MKKYLEIGAGKLSADKLVAISKEYKLSAFVDRSYNEDSSVTVAGLEQAYSQGLEKSLYFAVKSDIFDFLDTYKYKFDKIVANRIFEHMDYIGDQSVGRLLEACHMCLEDGGTLDIIVPNALLLAKKLIELESVLANETLFAANIDNELLILNTEFCNSGSGGDYHKSIWTPEMTKKYIEQEGVWKLIDMQDKIVYAGRDIYMRVVLGLK